MNILITGGASGLGLAITKKMADGGANSVFFTYNNSKEAASELEKKYSNARSFQCDFTRDVSIDKFALEVENMDLDILINNAITGLPRKHYHKMEAIEFSEGFKNNVLSVIKITQKAINTFRKKKSGRIITVLSTALTGVPPIGWSAYTAEKAYLLSLSNSWAQEYSKFNITSNCVSPSFMLTDLNKDVDERQIEEVKSSSPTGRLLTTEETAQVIAKLAFSKEYINGVNLVIKPGADAV